jgi:hypothetical protein
MVALLLQTACGPPQPTGPAVLMSMNPRNFSDPTNITNKWLPYTVGTKTVHQGIHRGLPQVVQAEVTDQTRVIDGVLTRGLLDRDIDGGQLIEETLDYFAQDNRGNVWYFGELTTHYVNGQLTDHADTWYAGQHGDKAGIIMYANPRVGIPRYQQEYAKNLAEDKGKVIAFNQSVCVPYRCFQDAMEIQETSRLDPGVVENKFYVAGIGMVRAVITQGDPEESNLVSFTAGPSAGA